MCLILLWLSDGCCSLEWYDPTRRQEGRLCLGTLQNILSCQPSLSLTTNAGCRQHWGRQGELCLIKSNPGPHSSLGLKMSQKGRGNPRKAKSGPHSQETSALPLPLSWIETAQRGTAPQAGVSPRVPRKHRCGKAGCSCESKNSAIWSWEDPPRRFECATASTVTNLKCPETHTPGPNHRTR